MHFYRFDRAKPKKLHSTDISKGFECPRFITAAELYYGQRFTSFSLMTFKNNMMLTDFMTYTDIVFKDNVGPLKLFVVEYTI